MSLSVGRNIRRKRPALEGLLDSFLSGGISLLDAYDILDVLSSSLRPACDAGGEGSLVIATRVLAILQSSDDESQSLGARCLAASIATVWVRWQASGARVGPGRASGGPALQRLEKLVPVLADAITRNLLRPKGALAPSVGLATGLSSVLAVATCVLSNPGLLPKLGAVAESAVEAALRVLVAIAEEEERASSGSSAVGGAERLGRPDSHEIAAAARQPGARPAIATFASLLDVEPPAAPRNHGGRQMKLQVLCQLAQILALAREWPSLLFAGWAPVLEEDLVNDEDDRVAQGARLCLLIARWPCRREADYRKRLAAPFLPDEAIATLLSDAFASAYITLGTLNAGPLPDEISRLQLKLLRQLQLIDDILRVGVSPIITVALFEMLEGVFCFSLRCLSLAAESCRGGAALPTAACVQPAEPRAGPDVAEEVPPIIPGRVRERSPRDAASTAAENACVKANDASSRPAGPALFAKENKDGRAMSRLFLGPVGGRRLFAMAARVLRRLAQSLGPGGSVGLSTSFARLIAAACGSQLPRTQRGVYVHLHALHAGLEIARLAGLSQGEARAPRRGSSAAYPPPLPLLLVSTHPVPFALRTLRWLLQSAADDCYPPLGVNHQTTAGAPVGLSDVLRIHWKINADLPGAFAAGDGGDSEAGAASNCTESGVDGMDKASTAEGRNCQIQGGRRRKGKRAGPSVYKQALNGGPPPAVASLGGAEVGRLAAILGLRSSMAGGLADRQVLLTAFVRCCSLLVALMRATGQQPPQHHR
eukprot:GHVT01078861.1.p1 GENE.GHVT01078861.1~~GHVT01078861.1.p1  ORF type:complete len:767 (-),score=185.18 GHVT01078861.1:3781-6081(-)